MSPEPSNVGQLSAIELKSMIDKGAAPLIVDVRTPAERRIARIEGSRLYDPEFQNELLAMADDTLIVFQCHHGIRSQAVAEYFVSRGFRNVFNLEGGIQEWSLTVDPTVPRY